MTQPRNYLRHVDGLRALAVISVMLYHFGVRYTAGGYVGVDVFFVISGFLITRLIHDELQSTGHFDFVRFYIRRMRRLFPAFFVTCACTTVMAALLFSPSAFEQFGATLTAATLSVSNILFWTQSGYFDSEAHLKPLLHTWSLSIEEQFYLVWPAFLWILMARRSLRGPAVAWALIAAGLVSFALNAIWVHGKFDPDFRYAIFFLMPFRVFEFVIGGVGVFLLKFVRDRIALQEGFMVLGLALICYSIVNYDETLIFPYWNGLAPSVGALLVILSGQAAAAGKLLTNDAAVTTGAISYSLYLVHWPIVVFYRYVYMAPPSIGDVIMLSAITYGLAIPLYRYVETPFRKGTPAPGRVEPQKKFITRSASAMVLSCLFGMSIWAQDGWTWRQPQSITTEQIKAATFRRYTFLRQGCTLKSLEDSKHCKADRPFQVLVFGNSHETDGFNAITAIYGKNPAINLISFGSVNNCKLETVDGRVLSKDKWLACDKRFDLIANEAFVKKLSAVIFSVNIPFGANKQIYWDILARMQRVNPKLSIVVLGGYLNTNMDCAELFNRKHSFDACKDPQFVSYTPFKEREKTQVSVPSDLHYLYVDKVALLCPEGTLQSCVVEAGNEPFSYDRHHLSLPFAQLLGQRMAQRYGGELHKLGFPAGIKGDDKPEGTFHEP